VLDPGRAVGDDRPASSRRLLAEALPLLPPTADRPLLAIDLSVGDPLESLDLLGLGWSVLALTETASDRNRLRAELSDVEFVRLTIQVADFSALVLPPADLIYTGAALCLRPAVGFGPVWSRIVPATRPGGWLLGEFLGDRDPRAPDSPRTTLTRKQVMTLLSGFRIELLRERETPDEHVFDVFARRRPIRPSGH